MSYGLNRKAFEPHMFPEDPGSWTFFAILCQWFVCWANCAPNHQDSTNIQRFQRPWDPIHPGDSSRDLFIPVRWRSLSLAFPKGHVFFTIPKRARSQNCQDTKNSELQIKDCVFSIMDFYVRDLLFLKGFHDGFDGDSPLISRNTVFAVFAMKFRSPWNSINWSFCRDFHSLLLRVGHTGHVRVEKGGILPGANTWQKPIIVSELVNTGRRATWGMGKRVERDCQRCLESLRLESMNTPMQRSQAIWLTLHQFPFKHVPTIEQWRKPWLFAVYSRYSGFYCLYPVI